MAPSKPSGNKGASKGKGKSASDDADGPSSGGELKVANSLKLRHILCEKQTKSLEALAKIKAGTSFDAVATAYSEDKARHGGSLGWMTRAQMVGAFQDVCFTIPVSTCASPIYREIKTKHGYHIVMVEGRK
ncbi:BZ3500_MvSof-1268-A1-R1_Chr5-3g08214 [Microbotryum saponariae]|uniref:Peptidyl-prolyl cis-trans isomerase n=1 Tax=Microbotryum saponariae TaxID=289078 RepID=A0A2X0KZT1_9BASI|nr:BZ3500_MvSof-1268-A1-R1_Chr5-3g08214 [Microbotryum saponariae]SDA07973.1 BZ3501_MvSof-1269-A2-R1_Chr5-1g07358 [Microbotryum saponariae]